MLTILGQQRRDFCDGVSRRNFLRIGGLGALSGMGLPGLSLADALRHSPSGASSSGSGREVQPSVIMVFLPGGPPHQDLFDLKVDAPREIRGEFQPIPTAVPGIQICELLPRLAKIMDKLILIRSMVGALDRHESFQCMTGYLRDQQPPGGYPEFGSIIAKLQGPVHAALPPYVGLSPRMQHHPYNSGYPGCLGAAYAPFQPHGGGRDDLVLKGITLERLGDRRHLLSAMDNFRRAAEVRATLQGMDSYQQQAFGILTSSELALALDASQEPQAIRDRYGIGTDAIQGDAAPRLNQQFLVARRLVEAGARCVTLSYSFWDWHGSNFQLARQNMPDLDQATSALVEDLHERGLSDRVTVIVWGEFGRTPRINAQAGRDHWPRVSCALLAGGGMKTGQVIGATDRLGGEAVERPVRFQEVHATLYRNLGLDPHASTYHDLTGRPHYLIDGNHPALPEV